MMECMACGVPVIASEIQQNHELIDGGVSGVFVGLSVEELSDKMRLCMQMHSEVEKRARESILKNGSYSVEMTKAEKMYEDVLHD
jgi:glycosyltransferase involved in cell wall biosynthesis